MIGQMRAGLTSQLVLLATTLILFLIQGVRSETCRVSTSMYANRYTYCYYGCCDYNSDGCCKQRYRSTFTVAVGCSIGGVILLGVIIAVICCCVRRRGYRGQILTTVQAQPMVAIGGISGQYPMQPAANPWYPQPQAYGEPQPQAYGGPQLQASGGPPPHFQPGYNQPPGLPTYSPQSTNAAPSQPQGDGYQVNLSGKDGYPNPAGHPGYNQPAGHPGYSQPAGPPGYDQ